MFKFVPTEWYVVTGRSARCCPLSKGVGADLVDRFVCYYVISVGLVHHAPVGAFHHSIDQESLVGRSPEQGETSDE